MFKEGQIANPNGRPVGSQNKSTTAKHLFKLIMEKQVPKIEEALQKVEELDPAKYLDLLAKFFPYFYAKQIDVTTNGQALQSVMTVPEVMASNLMKSIPEKNITEEIKNDLDNSSQEDNRTTIED